VSTIPILPFTSEKIGETYLDLKSAPHVTSRAVVHRAIITVMEESVASVEEISFLLLLKKP
ncbi:hypothetical protein CCACVL1_17505, partial [Corchorus capsularis]